MCYSSLRATINIIAYNYNYVLVGKDKMMGFFNTDFQKIMIKVVEKEKQAGIIHCKSNRLSEGIGLSTCHSDFSNQLPFSGERLYAAGFAYLNGLTV